MPLSDAKIRSLHSTDRPYKLADFEGLLLLVKVSGAKSWRLKYRTLGKEKLLVIGDYPAISLSTARQARDAARADLAKGADPHEIKQHKALMDGEAKAQTFERLAEKYMAKIMKEGRAPATLEKYIWILDMVKPDIGRKPIAEITAPMVLKCLRKVEA